jgi:hypothetical protein
MKGELPHADTGVRRTGAHAVEWWLLNTTLKTCTMEKIQQERALLAMPHAAGCVIQSC